MAYTIAVDFDGTLCENKYPEIGKPNKKIINNLRARQRKAGTKLILWTCREGDELDEAVEWCRSQKLEFDAVNDNLPEHIEKHGNNSRKIHANEYWDDKAVTVSYETEV